MEPLSIGVIVVTRNRPKALAMSLPLILEQSYPPKEVLVVDSSDECASGKKLVEKLSTLTDVPMRHIESPPGMTLQRNIGLSHSTSDIVMFPDDDSLLFPNTLAELAEVYKADTARVIIGATPKASEVSPLHTKQEGSREPAEVYAPKSSGLFLNRLGKLYVWVERWVVPVPYVYLRREILEDQKLPEAVAKLGCTLVADQEGFRMSFRAEALRLAPFNENLTNYALGEDKDVCYGLSSQGIIVELPGKLVYHHEFPSVRQGGFRRGVVEILNCAYIISRHSEPRGQSRKAIFPWMRLLIAQTALRASAPYQRERLQGILAARKHLPQLLAASKDDLNAVYTQLLSTLLPND